MGVEVRDGVKDRRESSPSARGSSGDIRDTRAVLHYRGLADEANMELLRVVEGGM